MPRAKKANLDIFRIAPIKLDANGDLPTRIPIFITGDWPNSVKGNFSVSAGDLRELKEHFDAGIGFPTEDASTGLAIDFMHEYDGPAAAWIRGLELATDPMTGASTLYANPVEWTDEGQEAVKGGSFKCISPMGAFGSHDGQPTMWQSVTDLTRQLANVLEGAGLTNIPFLQGMSPIRAAALADESQLQQGGMFFVKDKERDTMNLDALRLKENKDVTAEERAILSANKDKLSAEEIKRFELDTQATDTLSATDRELLSAIKSGNKKVVDASATIDTTSTEDREMLAAIKSGSKKVVDAAQTLDTTTQEDKELLSSIRTGTKKVVDADMLSKLDKLGELESVAEQFKHDKAEQIVLSHIQRGAIKPDQKDSTTQMLLSTEGDARKSFESHLSALPSNELLASELGHDEDVNVDIGEELKQKTLDVQSKARAAGETLSYAQAQDRLMRDDADIKERYEASKLTTK